MNKVIFLDIDGVLITRRSCIPSGGGLLMTKPDPCGANLIKELCIKNNASIVISSTWRYNKKDLFELLTHAGIDHHFIFECQEHKSEQNCWRTPLTGKTKRIRGEEIKEWLGAHAYIGPQDKYVIFDDDSDFLEEQKPFLMRTTFDDGILTSHFRDAYKILKDTN